MLRIEPVAIADLPQISNLARLVWWDHYPGIISNEQIEYMLSKEYAQDTLSQALQSGTVSYIKLINDDELIGFASYSQTDNGNEMQLHKLYIHPRFQRMGYGSALLGYVHERAVQGGYKHLILAVNKNNRKAISAYVKNGFVIKESICVDIGNGFYRDDYIMRKM